MKFSPAFLFCVLAFAGLATSCSMQKRHYMKGYNVSWNENTEQQKSENLQNLAEQKRKAAQLTGQPEDLAASLRGGDVFLPEKKPVFFDKQNATEPNPVEECDLIVQRNGQEISAKVIEVNSTAIKYKNCAEPDGEELTIEKADVAVIKYANGKREVIPMELKPRETNTSSSNDENLGMLSNLGLVFGILSFIPFLGAIFGIIAIIMSAVVLHQYEEAGLDEPKVKHRAAVGLWLGIAGILFSVGLAIWIILDILLAI